MDPRAAIAVCAAVGLLGVGIGTGATLLFVERGPEGAQGERGAEGPEGPPGDAGAEVEQLSGEVSDLDSRVSDLELTDPATAIDDLDSRVSDVESTLSELCFALDVTC